MILSHIVNAARSSCGELRHDVRPPWASRVGDKMTKSVDYGLGFNMHKTCAIRNCHDPGNRGSSCTMHDAQAPRHRLMMMASGRGQISYFTNVVDAASCSRACVERLAKTAWYTVHMGNLSRNLPASLRLFNPATNPRHESRRLRVQAT